MLVIDYRVSAYTYDPFGVVLASTGTLEQPFMFSTKRYDAQTGLVYYGYRFSAPDMGKWLNRDPLGEAGGINLYGFVGNDPINWVDLWGLECETEGLIYDENGRLVDEVGLENPDPFLDPIDYLGLLGGLGYRLSFKYGLKIMIHGPHHKFNGKYLNHIQVILYKKGVKKSHRIWRAPLPTKRPKE